MRWTLNVRLRPSRVRIAATDPNLTCSQMTPSRGEGCVITFVRQNSAGLNDMLLPLTLLLMSTSVEPAPLREPVSLNCTLTRERLDGRVFPSSRTYQFGFETQGSTVDIHKTTVGEGSRVHESDWVGSLSVTPARVIITVRHTTASPRVWIDARFVIDRSTLQLTGGETMPGTYTMEFEGTCQVVESRQTPRRF